MFIEGKIEWTNHQNDVTDLSFILDGHVVVDGFVLAGITAKNTVLSVRIVISGAKKNPARGRVFSVFKVVVQISKLYVWLCFLLFDSAQLYDFFQAVEIEEYIQTSGHGP